MISVDVLSKILIVLEGLILAVPGLFGLAMFANVLSMSGRPLSSAELLMALLGLLSVCAFWYLFFSAVFNVFRNSQQIPAVIKITAFWGAVSSLISWVLVKNNDGVEFLAWNAFGVLFVPTYLHTLYEINRH